MPTATFLAEYENVKVRNKLLSYREKLAIWKLCGRDWDNGQEPMPYIPFEKAIPIHKSKARILVIAAGNRFAKSLIAAMEAVAMMTVPGVKIWVVGQEYDIVGPEWDYIEHALTKTDIWYKLLKPRIEAKLRAIGSRKKAESCLRVRKTKPMSIIIDYPGEGKSVIEQRSLTASEMKLEGAKLAMIIFSEGSRVARLIWTSHLKKRLSDRSGRVIFPATPKGRDEMLYPAYREGLSRELIVDIDWEKKTVTRSYKKVKKLSRHVDCAVSYMESYETFQHAGYDNPYYNVADYEEDVRLLFDGKLDPATFRETNFGTFESHAGTFYKGVDFDKVFVNSWDNPYCNELDLAEATHYRAIDPGRAKPACCLFFAVLKPNEEGMQRLVFYDEIYEKGLTAEQLAEKIISKTEYRVRMSVACHSSTHDTASSEKSVERQLYDCGIDPITTPHNMPLRTIDRLNYWLPDLKCERIIIYKDKCPNTFLEIQGLEFKKPSYRDGHAVGKDELRESPMHGIDCVTYAVFIRPRYIKGSQLAPLPKKKEEEIREGSFAAAVFMENRSTGNEMENIMGTF